MSGANREPSRIESEKAWFAAYYGEERFSRLGLRLRMERDLRLARRQIKSSGFGRVLSIGCGDGRFERMLAGHAEHVTGIDISPEAVAIARRKTAEDGCSNLDFEACTTDEFVWDGPYDVVFCMALLHHLPETEVPRLARRIFQHIAPGGLLFTLDPNAGAVLRKVGRVVLGSRYDTYHSPDERELDPGETESMLRAAGFGKVLFLPSDWTLIPCMYLLPRGPDWPLRLCDWVDRLCYRLPFRRWASGFSLAAFKDPTETASSEQPT